MNGQWHGDYVGTNRGRLIVDLDDRGNGYRGTVMAVESNTDLPNMVSIFDGLPKGKNDFDFRIHFQLVDQSGKIVTWDEAKKQYGPELTPATYADTKWHVTGTTAEVSWQTDAKTFGTAKIELHSTSAPSRLNAVKNTWQEFRQFARKRPPYRFIYRGQSNNVWRLRTSFHRTGRASLMHYMLEDVSTLYRHLSPTC